jgi:hypothetical protein
MTEEINKHFPAVTGVARDLRAAREVLVDLLRHGVHLASGHLVMVRVGREIALHVTKIATDAKTSGKSLHGRHDLVRLQNLQVLGRLLLSDKRHHKQNRND